MHKHSIGGTFTYGKTGESAISVRDVAAAAGVSIASVSRVLNASGYVSAEIRARVRDAVAATGYVPNFAARHLRTGRSKAVGFMVSNLANPFVSGFFAAVEAHMRVAGYSLLVASTYDRPEQEAELLTLFENRRLEGIFASPSTEGLPRAREPFARCQLPLVVIDRDVDCDGDVVLQDHRRGVAQALGYLTTLGHRRIALFGPSLGIRPGREKLAGYRDGLAAAGIDFDEALICMLRSAVDSTGAQMTQMLTLPAPPTALIALGTGLLSGALRAARVAGLRVPLDLSVIGIGTETVFALIDPPLTQLRFDFEKSASAAAQLMLSRIDAADSIPRRTVTLPMELVLGESCTWPGR